MNGDDIDPHYEPEIGPFCLQTKNTIPTTIEKIQIQLLDFTNELESEFQCEFKFSIEERKEKYITNVNKDECYACYNDTFTTSKCKTC